MVSFGELAAGASRFMGSEFTPTVLETDAFGRNRAANVAGAVTSGAYGLSEYALWKKSFITRMTSVSGVGELLGSSLGFTAANRYAFMPLVRVGLMALGVEGVAAFAGTVIALSALSSGAMTLASRTLHGTPPGSQGFAEQWATAFAYTLPSMVMGMGAMQCFGIGQKVVHDLLLLQPVQALLSTAVGYGHEAWDRSMGRTGQTSAMSFGERLVREAAEGLPAMLAGRAFGYGFDRLDAHLSTSPEMERQRFLARIDTERVQALSHQLQTLSVNVTENISAITAAKRELVNIWSQAHGGARPIQRVLIANNGMSAVRLIQGVRDMSGRIATDLNIGPSHHLIEIVGLAARADIEAKPRYLGEVDRLIQCRDKLTPAQLFLDTKYVLDLAEQHRADAVAVGWGFSAERPEFARACVARGLTFIGPPAAAMEALGGKISSKIAADEAGVSILPWSKAAVRDRAHAARVAEELGWQVAVKADAGGGGKGIKFLRGLADPKFTQWCVQRSLEANATQARTYVGELYADCQGIGKTYFNDETVFIEQLAPKGVRHIEIQVEVDERGHARALAERDCSPQIDNQKVFEEGGNGIVVPAAVRTRMYRSAERLAEQVGYRNVGTVECLYNPASDDFYFMEMNTRLQVEHPVTEELLGLDLVGQQLRRAMGIPFTRRERAEFTSIRPAKHVIAARINARGFNPHEQKFEPRTGTITRLVLPTGHGIRAYSSLAQGSSVSGHSDSQIVHVFASAATRQEACALLRRALQETVIEGVETTLPFSIAALGDPEFIAGKVIDTSWLEGFVKKYAANGESPHAPVALMAAAVHRFEQEMVTRRAQYNRELDSARQPSSALLRAESTFELPLAGQPYATTVRSLGDQRYLVTLDGRSVELEAISRAGQYTLTIGQGEQRRTHAVGISGNEDNFAVQVAGERFVIASDDPTRVRIGAPGVAVKVHVYEGQEVRIGDELVTSEAMKMFNSVRARVNGRVKAVHITEGSKFDTGALLVEIEPLGGDVGASTTPRLVFSDALASPFGSVEALKTHLAQHNNPIEVAHELFMRAMRGSVYSHTTGQPTIYSEALTHYGTAANLLERIQQLSDAFVEGERLFAYGSYPFESLKADAAQAFARAQSHALLPLKQQILISLLEMVPGLPYGATLGQRSVVQSLRAIGDLRGDEYRSLRYKSRALVAAAPVQVEGGPDLKERFACAVASDEERPGIIRSLAILPAVSTSHLLEVLSDSRSPARTLAAEVVVRRAYSEHQFIDDSFHVENLAEFDNRQHCVFGFLDRRDSSLHRIGIAAHIDNQVEGIDEGARRAFAALEMARARLSTDRNVAGDTLELVVSGLNVESLQNPTQLAARLTEALNKDTGGGRHVAPKRIVFTIVRRGAPDYYTFRSDAGGRFVEDLRFRGLHPHNANLIEMHRFEGWTLTPRAVTNPLVRSWEVECGGGKDVDRRLTTRMIVPDARVELGVNGLVMRGFEDAYEEAARAMIHELDGYEPKKCPPLNHLYLRVLAPINAPVNEVERSIRETILRHRNNGSRLRSTQVEVRATVRDPAVPEQYREALFILKRPTSPYPTLQSYMLMRDNGTSHLVRLERYVESLADGAAPLEANDKIQFGKPYELKSALDKMRLRCNAEGKTYVYDQPAAIAEEVRKLWAQAGMVDRCPTEPVKAVELVLDSEGQLEEVVREPMQNDRTFVGWRVHLHLPYEDSPRQAIVVSSDPTLSDFYGSISPREGAFYKAALELACREGLPFLQDLDGSGARIALDPSLLKHARFHESGIEYLTADSYHAVPARLDPEYAFARKVGDLVKGKWIDLTIDGQSQHVFHIQTIMGGVQGLNTENLTSGSGTMAGTIERAYWEIPTMTIAKGVLVGILKYIGRQGRRLIQVVGRPLLFTGKDALNALQSRAIFRTNQELGDYPVMGANGVAQYPARDGAESLAHWLKWLSYLPQRVGERAPVRPGVAIGDGRDIASLLLGRAGEEDGVILDKSGAVRAYDPKDLVRALFDDDSFTPHAEDWAPGVLTGHARLGGISCGLIVTDPRLHMEVVPANPMLEGSEQHLIPRPGQRWDTPVAFKTAQALTDFDTEGLPTIFVANFKGFPGGSFEMGYEAAVKYGSMIVEAVVGMRGAKRVRQPIIVLVPPYGAMRGGAQVVIDRAINPGTLAYLVGEHGAVSVLERGGMMALPMVAKPLAADKNPNARQRMETLVDLHQTPDRALAMGTVDEILKTGDLRSGLHRTLVTLMDRVDDMRDTLAATGQLRSVAEFLKIFLPNDLSTFDHGLLGALSPEHREAFSTLLRRACGERP